LESEVSWLTARLGFKSTLLNVYLKKVLKISISHRGGRGVRIMQKGHVLFEWPLRLYLYLILPAPVMLLLDDLGLRQVDVGRQRSGPTTCASRHIWKGTLTFKKHGFYEYNENRLMWSWIMLQNGYCNQIPCFLWSIAVNLLMYLK